MFSFLNTLEILPVEQVHFIAQVLGASGLDAAIMLKAKAGMPGFISVNAWTANTEPLCRTVATELVCCADGRLELRRILEEFCEEVQAAANKPIKTVRDKSPTTTALDGTGVLDSRFRGLTCDEAS